MRSFDPQIDASQLDEAVRAILPGRVEGDLACCRCAYNLRGLDPRGRCPECSAPMWPRLLRPSLLATAPRWRDGIRRGAWLLYGGTVGALVCLFTIPFLPERWLIPFCGVLASSGLVVLGLLFLTSPDALVLWLSRDRRHWLYARCWLLVSVGSVCASVISGMSGRAAALPHALLWLASPIGVGGWMFCRELALHTRTLDVLGDGRFIAQSATFYRRILDTGGVALLVCGGIVALWPVGVQSPSPLVIVPLGVVAFIAVAAYLSAMVLIVFLLPAQLASDISGAAHRLASSEACDGDDDEYLE